MASTVLVKVPHLAKKINVSFVEGDTIYNLIENIRSSIKDKECNFGIFLKYTSKNVGHFVKENIPVIDIICEKKIMYRKKERIFNSNIKLIKIINSVTTKELFVQYILKGDLQSVMKLLQNGFDPNYILNNEPPILYAVVSDNSVALITLLTSQGAHIDYRASNYETCLHKSIRLSKPETVKIILELGMYVDILDYNGLTPLNICIQSNSDVLCFEQLMKYNASKSCRNPDGETVLHQICFNNQFQYLDVLIRNGEDVNVQSSINGNSGLHFAVLGRALQCVSYLLNNGAIMDLKNNENLTAYDLAEKSFPEAVYFFETTKKLKNKKTIDTSENSSKDENPNAQEIREDSFNNLNIIKTSDTLTTSIKDENTNAQEIRENSFNKLNIIDDKDQTSVTDKIYRNRRKKEIEELHSISNRSSIILSPEIEKEAYFGLRTKIVEFKRSHNDGFGFYLESRFNDLKAIESFVPSQRKPSIHRISKWRVLSSVMPLFSKPYLLEVNEVYVGDMHHETLAVLINSIQDRIFLKITNIFNPKEDFNIENINVTSRINYFGKSERIE